MERFMDRNYQADVIVAGGGPAGLVCALRCAQHGLDVIVLEASSKNGYGRPCVTEIEKSAFFKADIPLPEKDEIAFTQKGMKIFSPKKKLAFESPGHEMYAVKLDRLVKRFAGYALDAGVTFVHGAIVKRPVTLSNRVEGVIARVSSGSEKAFTAPMVVDGTGHEAAVIRNLPESCCVYFDDSVNDHIFAEARIYQIDSKKAAQKSDAGVFTPEYVHHFLGVQGNFSTLSYLVSLETQKAFMLCGVKGEKAPPGPGQLMENLADELGIFKRIEYQGKGIIRIRRPSLKLVCDGFAAIGEAAGMVIPMHGSGVASGMLAGHTLGGHIAELIAGGAYPDTASLWPWCAAFQSGRGAILASYDALRRILEKLDPETEAELLIRAGVIHPEDMTRAFACLPVRPSLKTLPKRVSGVFKHPLLVGRIAKKMPRVLAVEMLWKAFPKTWNENAFYRWKTMADTLLPGAAD